MSLPDLSLPVPDLSWRANLRAAARFWEPQRIAYNAVLIVVVAVWVLSTWPHFRPAFHLTSLLFLLVLALLANLCYCAAYLVDVPLLSRFGLNLRWPLWVAGTLHAVLLECYCIADEIYPYV
jgi:hypothetical protein